MQEPTNYDIIIIGAGIQGAGVAQAAAASGYKTLVIEKHAAAGMGTSSKSSKLIHGGLRYLESGQLKLVRECLTERKLLLKNAPELVSLLPFYIPVYSYNSRPPWLIWLGLLIYSLFSFKPFSVIKKKHWKSLDDINLDKLQCVFKYYDAQTDDKQLTRAVIASAEKHNAEILYNAEFVSSKPHETLHQVTFSKNDKPHIARSHFLINCSGPWAYSVQSNILPNMHLPTIDLIAGTHIIIKSELKQGAYYVEAEDRRAVFFLPWKNQYTLIGTTERHFDGSPDEIKPTEEEIHYLLNIYNQSFNKQLIRNDVYKSFSGLRVLPGNDKSSFKKSRDSLLIFNKQKPGLITLVGGKLTAYRASAEEIMSIIKRAMPIKNTSPQTDTKKIKLTP